MRSKVAIIACSLALLFTPACSDDSGGPTPDVGADIGDTDTTPTPDLGTDTGDPDGPVVTPDGSPDVTPTPDQGGDMAGDTTPTPDVGTDMPIVTPDTFSPDAGPNAAGKCATAPTVTLTGGTVVITDDITNYPNEFATGCRTSTSSTTTMSGPQAYYKFQGVQDQWYRFVLEPTSTSFSAYMYVFTSTACTEAAIETDCTSDGASGASLRTTADGDDPRVLYFKAPANGPVYVAVDDTSTPTDGNFKLTITAIPTPTNGTCANATQLTFFNGKAVANGDTHHKMTPDEFPGVKCPSTAMDGPQAYFKFDAKANTSYKIKVTNLAGYFLYAYVFGNTCTEAAISADCGSGGTNGVYLSSSFDAPQSREIVFTPPAVGTYTIAVDGTLDYYNGFFTVEVEEFVLPTNGKCTTPDAVTLINGKATITGSTLGLTNEFGTNLTCTTTVDGEQAYYKLTAAAGKAYKLTYAPSFSSYWYIFRAGSCGATTAMQTDCQSGGLDGDTYGSVSSTTPETAAFAPVTPGDYIIALDSSAPGTAGAFQLDIEEFTKPTNGTACTPTAVTFTNGKATINGSTLGTTNEFGTNVDCGGSTDFDGEQAYYEFTVDATKGYKLTLSPTFSSAYMYVFQKGSCAVASAINADCGSGGLSGVYTSSSASATTSRTLTFSPSNSGQYVVAVDTTFVPNAGDFTLEIEEITKPTNDTCATAAPLTLTNGEVTVNSTTGFSLDEYATLNCRDRGSSSNSSNLDGPQLYWSLAMDATKTYQITATTSFSSGYLYVFDGSKACSETNIETDCQSGGATGIGRGTISSGSGTVYFSPPASGTYKIAIDSYNDSGDVTLKVVELAVPSNQTCATAKTLTLVNNAVTDNGVTVGTTDEFAGAIKCGGTNAFAGGQTYYRVNMQAGVEYTVSLTADYAAELYVFSAASNCVATAIDTDCASSGATGDAASITSTNGGSTSITFNPTATGDYYIAVDGEAATDIGGFELKVNAFIIPTLVVPTTGLTLDFETDGGGLAGKLDWEWGKLGGTFTGVNCESSGEVPPLTGATPGALGVWGTVINGCYKNAGNNQGSSSTGCNNTTPDDDSILTFNVTLPAGWTTATMTYQSWEDINTYFDFGEVRITDAGTTVSPAGGQVCTSGSDSATWRLKTIDMTPYIGKTVKVAFHLAASTVVNRPGWYIDEISFSGN
jgi:hypothetical protein